MQGHAEQVDPLDAELRLVQVGGQRPGVGAPGQQRLPAIEVEPLDVTAEVDQLRVGEGRVACAEHDSGVDQAVFPAAGGIGESGMGDIAEADRHQQPPGHRPVEVQRRRHGARRRLGERRRQLAVQSNEGRGDVQRALAVRRVRDEQCPLPVGCAADDETRRQTERCAQRIAAECTAQVQLCARQRTLARRACGQAYRPAQQLPADVGARHRTPIDIQVAMQLGGSEGQPGMGQRDAAEMRMDEYPAMHEVAQRQEQLDAAADRSLALDGRKDAVGLCVQRRCAQEADGLARIAAAAGVDLELAGLEVGKLRIAALQAESERAGTLQLHRQALIVELGNALHVLDQRPAVAVVQRQALELGTREKTTPAIAKRELA